MKKISALHPYIIAFVGGGILWVGTMIVSGRTEAWDSVLYWIAAYPSAIIIAGVLGYLVPEKPWRWALSLMLIQPVLLMIATLDFSMLPLGLILFGLLSLPPILIAYLMSSISKRRAQS